MSKRNLWDPITVRVADRPACVNLRDAMRAELVRDKVRAVLLAAGCHEGRRTLLERGDLQRLLTILDYDGGRADPGWVKVAHDQLSRSGPATSLGVTFTAGPLGRILRSL